MTNKSMKNTVCKAMLRLDSLMENCIKDYQKAREKINGEKNTEELIALDKEFLPIIERIGVDIADMYRLVKKRNPA